MAKNELNEILGFFGSILAVGALGFGLLGKVPDNVQNKVDEVLSNILGDKIAVVSPKETPVSQNETTSGEIPEWSMNYPDYYMLKGVSQINPSNFPDVGQITYGGVDSLGRTLTARGTLTFDNVKRSYGVRQQFSESDKPSGWLGNKTYIDDNGKHKIITYKIVDSTGRAYNGAFWNKSHLIADSLGGDAIKENIITGTRTQNVGATNQKGGMRYSEKKAQDWLESHHDGVLYYEAKPVYYQNELVPRVVEVSMLSSDKTINEKVVVFNAANGYLIDYTNGTFREN